jgi:ADP-ribose pyrophosphatase YjhB (NUDIX family)
MPRRVEYFDDPDAPRANSLVVAVTAVGVNDAGNVLLPKANRLWRLPGGPMNIGENIVRAVVREVKEETASVRPLGLMGIYSEPGHVIAYADGQVWYEVSICVWARIIGGRLAGAAGAAGILRRNLKALRGHLKAKDASGACTRSAQAEQQLDSSALAGAVGSDKAKN